MRLCLLLPPLSVVPLSFGTHFMFNAAKELPLAYEKQGYWIYDESEEDYVYIPSAEELNV